MNTARGLIRTSGTTALLMLAFVGHAQAASCVYDAPSGVLTVTADPHSDVGIVAEGDGTIVADNSVTGDISCGAATTTNTDSVIVYASKSLVAIDERSAPFAPGRSSEPSGSPEIEFYLSGTITSLRLFGQVLAPNSLVVGRSSANLNGDDDADVFFAPNSVKALVLEGGTQPDTLSANGGQGTGSAPFTGPVVADGGTGVGPDIVTGSGKNDSLYSESPGASISGLGGDDLIQDNAVVGGSFLDGGAGNDEIASTSTVGFDQLIGGAGNDHLIDDGGAGDILDGGTGNDELQSIDHGADQLDGGPGTDTAGIDCTGDVTANIENLSCLASSR